MTILIDILHPAHVHFFRTLIGRLQGRGFRVIVTARSKEMSLALLDRYGIPSIPVSAQKSGLGLVVEMLVRTLRIIGICRREKPVLLAGIMGPSIAVAGRVLGIPSWIFYDTENAWITNWFAYPLASRVYTPACYLGNERPNQIRYQGYHELAYLHPAVFTPDPGVLARYNIDPARPYSVVRFVGWQASHDLGEKGLSGTDKLALVHALARYGTVYITSESPLPPALQPYCLPVSIEDIHHLLAHARLFLGESATMASEAAVLGVPAIFISDTSRGYTLEQEKDYQLVFNLARSQTPKALQLVDYLLGNPEAGPKYARKRRDLLAEKIDVTAYLLEQILQSFPPGSSSCAA